MHAYEQEQGIELKTLRELEALRESGSVAAEVLAQVVQGVKPGIATLDLENRAIQEMQKLNARSAFLGYRGYPAHTCISLNHEVVHGIPSANKIIRNGDVVSIDIGIIFNGFYGDNATTIIAGTGTAEDVRLIEIAHTALNEGIKQARVGNRLGDICSTIQRVAENSGFSVVRDYVGHGIGRRMHEPPQIPNYGVAGTGPRLEPGMILALEPMVNSGSFEVKLLGDGWTVVTIDGKKSAHCEHMIAITENDPEILTVSKSVYDQRTKNRS